MALNASALASTIAVTLRLHLSRLTVWVFGGVFVWVAWLLYWGELGFGGMSASGAVLATNSEYAIATTLGFFSFFLMHFTATLTGDPVVVDARSGCAPLLRAMPVPRSTYLLGKFLGGYLALLSIYLLFLLALILGQFLPPAEAKLTLPARLVPYLEFAFLFVLVPTFFVGALSFAIGSLSGSMKLVYIAVTVLFVSWLLLFDLIPHEHYRWVAWLEPSGTLWLAEYVAKGRGNAWLNQHAIAIDGPFLLNRLALLAGGAACLGLTLAVPRGADLAAEQGGEVGPGLAPRLWRWLSGRQRELSDRYTNWSGTGAIPRVPPAPRGVALWLRHLLGSTRVELCLIAAERSLWIAVPVIAAVTVFATGTSAGPFEVPLYPLSSALAERTAGPLLVLIAGASIFYAGEVFHRDESLGLRSILYATPVANSVLLVSKLLATIALSACIVLLTYATAIVTQLVLWWRLDGRWYFDPGPYLELGLGLMLPAVVVIAGISLGINALARGRYLAYFALIALGAWYLGSAAGGQSSPLWNPLLLGHLGYSDMTGPEPFAKHLGLTHAYWGALVACLLLLATWFFPRSAPWRPGVYFSWAYARRRTGLLVLLCLATAGAVASGRRLAVDAPARAGDEQREAAALALEDRHLDQIAGQLGAGNASYASIDLEVELWPERGVVDARGLLTLVNDGPAPLAELCFTVARRQVIRRFEVEHAAGPWRLDDTVLCVPLDPALAPGERTVLELDWSASVHPRAVEAGLGLLGPSAVFLGSLTPHLVPLPGIDRGLLLADEERRAAHGRAPLALAVSPAAGNVPAARGSSRPFDLRLAIGLPAGLAALATGELVECAPSGPRDAPASRTTYVFETASPVRSFAIAAGAYAMAQSGDVELWYHPGHPFNRETLLAAAGEARAFCAQSFGPYPHRSLRLVEVPSLLESPPSYPMLVPLSETEGFLGNDRVSERFADATYFAAARGVARQWWGEILSPGASPGAPVLAGGLAEYAALVLLELERGERASLVALELEEAAYLRERDPDRELALADRAPEDAAAERKAALVFHMLERRIGRERVLAGLADLVRRFGSGADHATLADLFLALRAQHRGEDLEWFYDTWFQEVALPDMALVGTPELVREEHGWTVHFEAANLGSEPTAALPFEVELLAGRWRAGERDSMVPGEWQVSPPLSLWLAPGETARGTLSAAFAPEAIAIDRRHACLDFDRTNNVRALAPDAARASADLPGP